MQPPVSPLTAPKRATIADAGIRQRITIDEQHLGGEAAAQAHELVELLTARGFHVCYGNARESHAYEINSSIHSAVRAAAEHALKEEGR